jgi:hypothetical protein
MGETSKRVLQRWSWGAVSSLYLFTLDQGAGVVYGYLDGGKLGTASPPEVISSPRQRPIIEITRDELSFSSKDGIPDLHGFIKTLSRFTIKDAKTVLWSLNTSHP